MIARLRRRVRPAFVIWIVVMWCLLMGEITWGNVLAGFVIGMSVVVLLPLPAMPLGGIHVHWLRLLCFLGIWLRDLFAASVKVAWLALRPAPPPKTAIIRMPMRVSSELVLYFATVAYNLQPGGTVSDIDIANRMWTVHLLDVNDEHDLEREARHIENLERRMIRIFEEG